MYEVWMGSRKTSVAIDEELYEEVRSALGTETLRQTIEQAFLEVLTARVRAEEVQALREMRGMDLDDSDVMEKAWRN